MFVSVYHDSIALSGKDLKATISKFSGTDLGGRGALGAEQHPFQNFNMCKVEVLEPAIHFFM